MRVQRRMPPEIFLSRGRGGGVWRPDCMEIALLRICEAIPMIHIIANLGKEGWRRQPTAWTTIVRRLIAHKYMPMAAIAEWGWYNFVKWLSLYGGWSPRQANVRSTRRYTNLDRFMVINDMLPDRTFISPWHMTLLRRWINVIDVDSTSLQRRVPGGLCLRGSDTDVHSG